MSTQSRSLFAESKSRLCERIAANIHSMGSVSRQIIKGSKSVDILSNLAKNYAAHENCIENTELSIKKLRNCSLQLKLQLEDVHKSCEIIDGVVAKMK